MYRHRKVLAVCAIAGVVIAVVTAVDPAVHRPYHIPKYVTGLVLLPGLYVVWLSAQILRAADVQVRITIVEMLLAVHAVWLIVSAPHILFRMTSEHAWMLFGAAGTVYVVRQLIRPDRCHPSSPPYLTIFLRALWILGSVQALIGIRQWFSSNPEVAFLLKTQVVGTVGPPNGMGIVLSMAMIAALADLLTTRSIATRIAVATGIVIIAVALALNQSRGAILALLITLAVAGFVLARIHRGGSVRHPAMLLLGALVVLSLGWAGLKLYDSNRSSSEGRWMIWSVSYEMLRDNPVSGVGLDGFSRNYLEYQAEFFAHPENRRHRHRAAPIGSAHNQFLDAFVRGGIPGGTLFASIWITAFLCSIRSVRAATDTNDKKRFIGLSALYVVALAHGVVDDPLSVPAAGIIVYSALGFIPAPGITIRLRHRAFRSGILVACTAMLAASAWQSIHQYRGHRSWHQGLVLASSQQWPRAIGKYEEARRFGIVHGELVYHLGAAHSMNGSWSRGIAYMEEALDTINDRNLLLSLGYAHLRRGDLDSAQHYAIRVTRMFPDHITPYLLLGEVYHELGDHPASKAALARCINRETRIQSPAVARVAAGARELWDRFFPEEEDLESASW